MDAVDFGKATVQIVERSWDIAFTCPKILFGSNYPGACAIARWVDRCITDQPNDVSLYYCTAQGIGVSVRLYVVP